MIYQICYFNEWWLEWMPIPINGETYTIKEDAEKRLAMIKEKFKENNSYVFSIEEQKLGNVNAPLPVAGYIGGTSYLHSHDDIGEFDEVIK